MLKSLPANAGDTGQSLIWEAPTSLRATESQLLSLRSRARELQLLSPRAQEPGSAMRAITLMKSPRTATKNNPRSPQLQKSPNTNEDPAQP